MPTYVYRSTGPAKGGCVYCRKGFEIVQRITEAPVASCPRCHQPVSRVLFPPRFVVKGSPLTQTERQIRNYEKEGKWSHAAELADKEGEKSKRADLKTRALENYKKAGYHFDQ